MCTPLSLGMLWLLAILATSCLAWLVQPNRALLFLVASFGVTLWLMLAAVVLMEPGAALQRKIDGVFGGGSIEQRLKHVHQRLEQ